jgi:hypothetical protein
MKPSSNFHHTFMQLFGMNGMIFFMGKRHRT